jgi:hypothetical protein
MMRRAFFLLYPGFDLLDFAGPMQSLYEAKKLGLEIELITCSRDARVACDQGIVISDLAPAPGYEASDWVFVPGHALDKHEIPRWLVS